MRSRYSLALFVLGLGLGCGDRDGTATGDAAGGGVDASRDTGLVTGSRDQAIVRGFLAPSRAHEAGESAITLTVEAVVAASLAATGGTDLVTTGTLTQSGASFTYAPGPDDRLVINWTDGPQTALYVSALDGDFEAETTEQFLSRNHMMTVRVVREGLADFTVTSNLAATSKSGSLQGMLDVEGIDYQVDLSESGTTQTEFGSGVSYESTSTMTGTVTAPGFDLVAQEDYSYQLITVTDTVINRSRQAASAWTVDGNEYLLDGLSIRSATVNGSPVDPDYWRAEGSISENGALVGEVTHSESEVAVEVFLNVVGGEQILLERFLKT